VGRNAEEGTKTVGLEIYPLTLEFFGTGSVPATPLRWRSAWAVIALTFAALNAFAQAPEETKATESEETKPVPSGEAKPPVSPEDTKSSGTEEKKRGVPDYDGRGPEPTSFGRAALWVPRIIASPLYLTTEYLITAPLGAFVTAAEKHRWPTLLIDFFTFGEDHEAGLIPLVLYDFGLRPTVGLYFFWDRAFSKANSLRASVAYGGTNWVAFGASAGRKFSDQFSLSFSAGFSRRPDAPFYGIGPNSSNDLESRYAFQRVEAASAAEWRPKRWSVFRATVGVRDFRFRSGSCCNDPSVYDRVARGELEAPPGLGQPYTALLARAELAVDSRRPRPRPQSGARLALNVEEDVDTLNAPHSWIRYGGTLAGFWDITGEARVLSLSVATIFVDPTTGGPIPFTELATLGGTQPFVGYLYGRLVDRSAIAAQLRYEWPVWAFLDGELHAAVGNVFGEHLEGLKARLMRLSAGIGVRSSRGAGPGFEFLIGLGTEPFDTGFRVSSFRLVFGSTYGF